MGVKSLVASAGLLDGVELSGITNAITSDAQTLIPIGITIMSIMIGASLVPKILYKFF